MPDNSGKKWPQWGSAKGTAHHPCRPLAAVQSRLRHHSLIHVEGGISRPTGYQCYGDHCWYVHGSWSVGSGCYTARCQEEQHLPALPKDDKFIPRIKFLCEQAEGDWVVEDKFGPFWAGRKQGQAIIEILWDTKP